MDQRWWMGLVMVLLIGSGLVLWPDDEMALNEISAPKKQVEPWARTTDRPVDLQTALRNRGVSEHSPFKEACRDLIDTDLTQEMLPGLIHLHITIRGLEQTLARCAFSPDELRELMLEHLAWRIEEGDWSAAKLAYALAGSECPDPPIRIDHDCTKRAQEEALSLNDWRFCIQDGYREYQRCANDALERHGLNSEQVHAQYLSPREKISTVIDQMQRGEVEETLESSIDILEQYSGDRLIVESMDEQDAGIIAAKLFSLSNQLGEDGDEEHKSRINTLLVFWGTRFSMEQLLNEPEPSPYIESFVVLEP